ncbi:MAG TPA: hypothetical protein VHT04_14660 [Stellaceae bacterium]|nr:hypothetical protein [Stellaceae bacterium]
MLRHFFAAPDFFSLLRFWDANRAPSGLVAWNDDLARVPSELLPNLIIVDWVGEPRYRYIGSECVDRFGDDPTGRPLVATLGGAYANYIRSLGDETLARREPIFSACIFEVGDELMVTGRLFTPFAEPGADEPTIIVSVHMFSRAAFKLSQVGRSGFVNESQRLLIAGVPEVCEQLDKARRYHRLARAVPGRVQATEWADVARKLSRTALIALRPFREAIG